jgi:hypothetical protein
MQVVHPSDAEEYYGKQRQEFILEDDDCPLELLAELPPTAGLLCHIITCQRVSARQCFVGDVRK